MLAIGTKVIVTKYYTNSIYTGMWGLAEIIRHDWEEKGTYGVRWLELSKEKVEILRPHKVGSLSPNWERHELMPVATQSIINLSR